MNEHPIHALIRDAQARAPRALRWHPHSASQAALDLRTRIATAMALLEAAAACPSLTPAVRARCMVLRAGIASMPQAWEGAFGYAWTDGRVLKPSERKRSPLARAMADDVWNSAVPVAPPRAAAWKPWQDALGAARVIRDAHRIQSARDARARRDAADRADGARTSFYVESCRKAAIEGDRRRRAEAERQAAELAAFRAQPHSKFKQRQRVR